MGRLRIHQAPGGPPDLTARALADRSGPTAHPDNRASSLASCGVAAKPTAAPTSARNRCLVPPRRRRPARDRRSRWSARRGRRTFVLGHRSTSRRSLARRPDNDVLDIARNLRPSPPGRARDHRRPTTSSRSWRSRWSATAPPCRACSSRERTTADRDQNLRGGEVIGEVLAGAARRVQLGHPINRDMRT